MATYRPTLGRDVLEALGIDPSNVRALTLRCAAGEAPFLDLQMFVDDPSGDVSEVLRRYSVVDDLGHAQRPRRMPPVQPPGSAQHWAQVRIRGVIVAQGSSIEIRRGRDGHRYHSHSRSA